MTSVSFRFNLDGLEKLRAGAKGMRARVGIIGDGAVRNDKNGINNAELGLIQLVGSDTHNIPPRDWLLMPIQLNQKEILKSMSSSTIKVALAEGDYKRIFLTLGAVAKGFISQAFASRGFGQWAPNKPSTIARKGSSMPLIDTRQLDRAVSYDVVSSGSGKGV